MTERFLDGFRESTSSHENEPVRVGRFICVDVDRCVLKTTAFFENYIMKTLYTLAEEQCGRDTISYRRRMAVLDTLQKDQQENEGMAFDFMAVYNERIDETHRVTAETIAERIVESMSEDSEITQEHIEAVLADGTIELIQTIHAMPDADWAFLTSGGEITQWVKLNVLSLILQQELGILSRAQIVTTEHKTRDIDTLWRNDDEGGFSVPGTIAGVNNLVAQTVIILDDKEKNLVSNNMKGIITLLVRNPESKDISNSHSSAVDLTQATVYLNDIDK